MFPWLRDALGILINVRVATSNVSVYVAGGKAATLSTFGGVKKGQGRIHYSFDSGETWKSVEPPNSGQIQGISLYANRPTPKGHAIAESKDFIGEGKIFETTDGVTWKDITPNDQEEQEEYHGLDNFGYPGAGLIALNVCGSVGMLLHRVGFDATTGVAGAGQTSGDTSVISGLLRRPEGSLLGSLDKSGVMYRKNRNSGWKKARIPKTERLNAIGSNKSDRIAVGNKGSILYKLIQPPRFSGSSRSQQEDR